jgi:type IV pilus assembly protein PilY1
MNTPRTLSRISLLCFLLGAGTVQAVSISDTPLFLTQGVVPNLVMSFDDSNSMGWGYVPDALRDTQAKIDGPRFTAASYNPLAYNPKVEYTVPTRFDGVSYSTSFTQAHVNGFDTAKGYADLSNTTNQSAPNQRGYKPIVDYFHNNQSDCTSHALSSNTTWGSCRVAYVKYQFNCTVAFDNRSGNDRITVSSCSPSSGPFVSTNQMVADTILTIENAGSGFNGTYTVTSITNSSTLSVSENFSFDTTKSNVILSWTASTARAAFYTVFYSERSGAAKPAGCDDNKETDACYLRITVGSSDDQAITGKSEASSKQNFAQWYSFYRTRALASMSAAMRAITSLKTNEVRFAWQAINTTNCGSFGTTCKDSYSVNHENRIRPLDALKSGSTTVSHRTDFYNWLQHYKVDGGTPLRGALTRVGEYFRTSGQDSPYAEDPYISQGTELACRKNFHILFTDGLWNQDSGFSSGGNLDSISTNLPDGKTYTSRSPYQDSYENTLADVAFKYWTSDLRSDLGNTVAPQITDRSGDATTQYWNPKNNPATWQNLVNYPIGLGLGSFLTNPSWGGSTYTGDYSALAAGTKSWPSMSTQANRVYDLWHAAINSRGQFFNADSPDELITAFQSAMTSILAANPSAAALAANSTSIQTGTLVYQARFDSTDWHGELLAYPIQGDGSIGSAAWNAANLMPAATSRNIFTFDGSTGRTFTSCSSSMSAAQKTALDTHANGTVDNLCSSRLAWLRGDASQEAAQRWRIPQSPRVNLGRYRQLRPGLCQKRGLRLWRYIFSADI